MNNDTRKRGYLIKLAAKNIRAYGWLNAKMCFTFACLAFLICLFTSYNMAIEVRKENYLAETASGTYLFSSQKSYLDTFIKEFDNVEFSDTVNVLSYQSQIYKFYGVGVDPLSAATKYLRFAVDGESYNAKENINMQTVALPERGIFHRSDFVELKARFGLDSLYLSGEEPKLPDEVALGENIVETYKMGDVLGKTIECYVKNPGEGDDTFMFSAKVCGIIRKEYYMLTGHNFGSEMHPAIIFHGTNPLFAKASNYKAYYRAYLTQRPDAEWLDDTFDKHIAYIYKGAGELNNASLLVKVQILASTLYIVIGSALIVSLVLTIFLMIDKYMKVFARTSGIFMTMGMQKRTLLALLALQLAILCAFAIPLAFGLSFTGYYVIRAIIKFITRISLDLSVSSIVGILMAGIAVVITVAALFFAYASWRLRKKTIKEMLVTVVD